MWLLQQYNINLSSHLGEKWEDKSLEGIFSAGGKFSSWLKAERGGCGRCTPGSDGTRRGTGGGLRFWEDQHQLSATVTQNLSQISGASIFTRSPAVLPSLSSLYSRGFEKMNTESKFKHRWQANWRKSLDKPSLWPMSREYLPRIAQLLHYCPLSPARVSNRPSTCNT